MDTESVIPEQLWDFEDPSSSLERFRALRAAATGDSPADSVLASQEARALGLLEQYAEAHGVLDGLDPSLSPEVATRIHLERGRLLRTAGHDPAHAATEFEAAASAAGEAGLEALHVDALHMLALMVESPADQAAANRRALDVALASQEQRARDWDASLLNNLGCALVDDAQLEEALETFRQALTARIRIGSAREIQIARWMVGWTLRLLGRTDEARTVQHGLRLELDAAGIEDEYVDEELALLGPADEPS
ncbi:hypothetical protein ASD66_03260 [Nocardioides sp. Root151]|nr:hypothetical protein ASD66_03260 [Nocardioides sp. Root151]